MTSARDGPTRSHEPQLQSGTAARAIDPLGVVILVDDDPHHRIPLTRTLHEQGFRVLPSADKSSGETLCRVSKLASKARPPDLLPVRGLTPRGGSSMHETRISDLSDGQPETIRDASQLVGCFWCERIHFAKHPLSVCLACTARYSTLRSLEMRGSYPLSDGGIDEALTRTSPGNYALGYMDGDSFSVFYVGRSDSDLRGRLHEWVGMPSEYERYASGAKAPWAGHRRGQLPMDVPMLGRVGNVDTRYTHFAYSYSDSAAAAFEKERRNFEDFGGSRALDNQTEPVSAAG